MSKPLLKRKHPQFSPLKSLLLSKGYTIPDLKCEVALMFCVVLFDIFLLSKEKNINHALIESSIDEEEYIYNKIKLVNEQLKATILSIDAVESYIKNASSPSLSKIYLPYKVLYNAIVQSYLSKKDSFIKEEEDGKKYWMPELIGIYIIGFMKVNNYAFNKIPFIKEENFTDLIDRYIRTNRVLQQTKNFKVKSENLDELSIISKTRIFAQHIVQKIIETKLT